jgi:hypothetical protein
MPQYFYPFLRTTSKLPQFEFLRVASLGVICALAKVLHLIDFIFFIIHEFIFTQNKIIDYFSNLCQVASYFRNHFVAIKHFFSDFFVIATKTFSDIGFTCHNFFYCMYTMFIILLDVYHIYLYFVSYIYYFL